MFEYAQGRFVNLQRVICANVYNKDNTLRVAIDLDVSESSRSTVYTAPFDSHDSAVNWIKAMPVLIGVK